MARFRQAAPAVKRPGSSRLAVRHLLAILVLTLLFSGGASVFQIRTQYVRGLQDREGVLEMIETSYAPPVAAGVFFFDSRQLRLLADGIALLPYVESVVILERRSGDEHPIVSAGAMDDEDGNSEAHGYPLVFEYDGRLREIGSLRVTTSLAELRARIADQVRTAVLTTLLMIIGYGLVVLVVAQRMIFRRLKVITTFVHDLDPDHLTRRKLPRPQRMRLSDEPDELDEITDAINMMLDRLDGALAERKSLLHELYHRTGNMMQSVRAILRLESAKAGPDARFHAAMRAVDNRILAMALVHQKLYQSSDLSRIDMQSYLSELGREILRSYDVADEHVHLEVDAEQVSLLIDSAIPCGMIVSELLSNSLQHAFPDGRGGSILVSFHRVDDDRYRLTVADDGIGVDESFNSRGNGTIGISSVVAMAEKQLRGRIECDADRGVRWAVSFSDDVYRERVHDG